jgi:hypothetical protein
MSLKTAWNDYFTGTPTNLNSQTFKSRQIPSETSVYVSNCLFISITSTDNGGALCCNSVTSFLVESTSFFSCKTSSQNGGAIYFYNSSGQGVLYGVCGYDCYSTNTSSSNNQFAYMYVKNSATTKNYLNYSSIARCVNENSGSRNIVHLYYGKICCPSVNISMNKCQYNSGIYCYTYSDMSYIACSFSYSSFVDNIAIQYTCLYLWAGSVNFEIKSCNILRNTHDNLNSNALISTCGNVTIKDSCILENEATYIFYSYYSQYPIVLSNCTIDKTTIIKGSLKTQNTITKSFILALNHMSTLKCHSEYDSVGTLTPITPPMPSPSSWKKQIRLCTCGHCFNHPRLRDVFSLTYVIIFNFIHSDAF